ncbi:MAG: marine proteobacterial sortase target protein [Gammaproteobacteria bacterium]|nr:marine proteobacterial sortase target protein [Gammaproteobacteria bacterium]
MAALISGHIFLATFAGKLLLGLLRIKLITILIAIGVFVSASKSTAEEFLQSPADVTHGSLLIKDSRERVQQLPLLDTQVTIKVSGLIARVTVKQFFENNSGEFIEANYIFPLPEDSAVDHMSMLIGDRRIIGEIKEKTEARKIYQQARQQGKKTALLEQKRSNLFISKIANISPGETVEVSIEYQQAVHFEQGVFSLRYPVAITPRYNPADTKMKENFQFSNKSSWGNQSADPVLVPILSNNTSVENSLSIDVELNPGLPMHLINSPYHNIIQQKNGSNNYLISLQNYQISNKDFELRWQAEESNTPRIALFREQLDEEEYLMLMVSPPETDNIQSMPRELTLVVDKSGSMEGTSMSQAINALQQVLGKLKQGDRFNIIAFNQETYSLFEQPVEADHNNISKAKQFVATLQAEGGTEMMPALVRALSEPATSGYVRQIVFLTDGAVSNEDGLFSVIHTNLGDARLFTVGIGSAPNSYFMRKAAQFGRGSFTYIGKVGEVSEKMTDLFKQLENPVMQNIVVDWPVAVEQFPESVPDLYMGQPLMLRIKADNIDGEVNISGEQGSTLWQASVPINTKYAITENSNGVGVLWARAKIASLLDQQIVDPYDGSIRQQVVDLALQHHLVSRYTSLVAVEQPVSRMPGQPLHSKAVANHAPDGGTFGYPSTASGWQQQLLIGGFLMLLSLLLWSYRRYSICDEV